MLLFLCDPLLLKRFVTFKPEKLLGNLAAAQIYLLRHSLIALLSGRQLGLFIQEAEHLSVCLLDHRFQMADMIFFFRNLLSGTVQPV